MILKNDNDLCEDNVQAMGQIHSTIAFVVRNFVCHKK